VIRAKVEMVTEAYFQQRNFSNTDLVRSLFAGLSQTLSTAIDVDALFLGIYFPLPASSMVKMI